MEKGSRQGKASLEAVWSCGAMGGKRCLQSRGEPGSSRLTDLTAPQFLTHADVAFTWQLHKLVAASRFYQCSQSCPTLCDSMGHSCQAPLSMEFFRREASSGLPWPPPGDLLDPGIEPLSPSSPVVAGDCSPLSHQGNFEWRGASTLAPLAVWVQDGLGVRESLRQELPLWSRGKTLCSQCRGSGFDPWSGNKMPQLSL